MRYNSIFLKIIFAFSVFMILANIYLIYHLVFIQSAFSNISKELNEVIKSRNEFRYHLKQNFNLFKIPISDVEKSFTEANCSCGSKPCYIVFIPSHACKACISTFFSEIKTTQITAENIFLISELNDQVLQRLWMSYGYNKEKFIFDTFNIFEKSGINDKIVIMKFIGDMCHYDFLQYEIFLGKLLQDFINDI
jgi:hypothetical protein